MVSNINCPFCFQTFAIELYLEDGEHQEIVYDCEICCHPIEVHATWSESEEDFSVETAKSSGFE